MKTKHISLYLIFISLSIGTSSAAFDPTEAEKIRMEIERLEQLCEAAREIILVPERAALIEECNIDNPKAQNNYCENFYSTYGQHSFHKSKYGRRSYYAHALYYDIPQCVEAHEYRKNNK